MRIEILIKVVEEKVKRHGDGSSLTLGHLLDIVKMYGDAIKKEDNQRLDVIMEREKEYFDGGGNDDR